jgi:hypothetical protein
MPNVGKDLSESCFKFCPFCMAWMKVRKMEQIFNRLSSQFSQIWQKSFGLLWNQMKIYGITFLLQKLKKFYKSRCC